MRKIVVFCQSYMHIDNALYIAEHNHHDSSVDIVIIGNYDLLKFFKDINSRIFNNAINLIYFELYYRRKLQDKKMGRVGHVLSKTMPPRFLTLIAMTARGIYRLASASMLREKRHIRSFYDRYLAALKEADIYIFSRCFSEFTFYFSKRLSKRNRVIYMYGPDDLLDAHEYTPQNLIDLVNLMRLKLVYGRDMTIGRLPYVKGFSYIPDKFLKENVDKVIDWEERSEMMKGFDLSRFRVFDVGDYSVMYFHQDLVGDGYASDIETFKRELNEIFGILVKHVPQKKIARKYHPKYSNGKNIIEVGDVLPDWIPAEFLYNENVKIYLSLYSMSLANVERGLAVSLMDLITFKNDRTREQLKEVLIQMSRSKVLFPKSLDEFERIIVDSLGANNQGAPFNPA